MDFKNNLFICIVGSSRSGKSSFVRALRWLFFDRWKSSFIRIGSSTSSLTINFNSNVIKREKGKTKNDLIINGQKFSSFGNDYPLEFLSIFPWALSKFEKLVIASQDDFPFLLYEDSSLRREIFDFLIGIDGLTKFTEDIQHELNKKNVEERMLKGSIDELKERVKGKDEILKIYSKILDLYEKVKLIEERKNNIERLLKLKNFIQEISEKIYDYSRRICFLQENQEKIIRMENLNALLKLREKIDEIKSQLILIDNSLKEKESLLSNLIKEGLICPTCGQLIVKL
ncbi:MAG: AAA family ATPase [Nitrososphaerota archaeon]